MGDHQAAAKGESRVLSLWDLAAVCPGGHIFLSENWGITFCQSPWGSRQASQAGGFAPGRAASKSHLRRPLAGAD
jgi:hypothetical protein